MYTIYSTKNIPKQYYFNFDDLHILVEDNDFRNPWFLSYEVCSILEYANAKFIIRDLVSQERKRTIGTNSIINKEVIPYLANPYVRRVSIINLGGLNELTISSRMPKALEFRDWVTGVVLTDIALTGAYDDRQHNQQLKNINDQIFAINGTCEYVDPRTGSSQQFYNVEPKTQQQMDQMYINPDIFKSVFGYDPNTYLANYYKLLLSNCIDNNNISLRNYDPRRCSSNDTEIWNMAINTTRGGVGIRDYLTEAALHEVELREEMMKQGKPIPINSIFGYTDTTANRATTPKGTPVNYVVLIDPLKIKIDMNDPKQVEQRMLELISMADMAEKMRRADSQLGYGDYNTNDYEGMNMHYDDELDNNNRY